MTGKLAYSYAVLRYVHDVVTGEFVNVGVVLHVPETGSVETKFRSTFGRIKETFPNFDKNAFRIAMRSVEKGIGNRLKDVRSAGFMADDIDAGVLVKAALPPDDSSLQWSSVGSGFTADPVKALNRLYDRMVALYDHHARHRRTDDDVWKPVRDKLLERGIAVQLDEKTIAGRYDEIEFKHAWKNGAWHVYEPVSLDLADADGIKDKARRWFGHLATVEEGLEEEVKLHLLVGAPQDPALRPAYDKAIEILGKARFDPKIYEDKDVSDLVDNIDMEFRSHSEPV